MEIPNHKIQNNFLLGIDTGGTYTDGVLLDDLTRQVVATAKTHTTRHDLTECILKVLDDLLPDEPDRIRLEYAQKITRDKVLARANVAGTIAMGSPRLMKGN